MKSLPIGSLVMLAVLAYSLMGMNFKTMLNMHSIVLVMVGTVAVLAMSTPANEIRALFKALWALTKNESGWVVLNKGLIDLSKRKDSVVGEIHPLIVYAQELWEQGLDSDMIVVLLTQKLDELNRASEQSVATMRNLAKYPPALGMTGTVIGLVSLFSHLGPDSKDKLGPSLALAMTATFYGLMLANMVLLPLADRLHVQHLSHVKKNEHVYRVLLLIEQGEPPSLIEGEVNAAVA